ncbi:MFS transporter [Desulfatiferula olefinivorans]
MKPSTWPLSLQYFFYFGVMGMFLPFFNLYCYHLEFTGFQIGILSAARTLSIVVFSLAWGIVADRYAIRRPVYLLCNAASAAIWTLYLFTGEFYPMLAVTIAYGLFYGPIIAFLEALTMDTLGRDGGKRRYGAIRVWGSVSFIALVVISGYVVDLYPVRTIVILILVGSVVQALLAPTVPPGTTHARVTSLVGQMRSFINLRMVIFLTCSFLMLASHGTYYGFFSIHLEQLGFGPTFISLAWALASVAEIGIMLNSDRLFRRFSIRTVLITSFVAAALRWLLLFVAVSPEMILLSQLFHALTYGAFHIACILYMDQLSSPETKTFGQVANNAVSYGLGMMAGFVFNGYFFEAAGVYLYLASALTALSGALLFLVSGSIMTPPEQ